MVPPLILGTAAYGVPSSPKIVSRRNVCTVPEFLPPWASGWTAVRCPDRVVVRSVPMCFSHPLRTVGSLHLGQYLHASSLIVYEPRSAHDQQGMEPARGECRGLPCLPLLLIDE